MKSRWLVNFVLFILVAALGSFVYFRPKDEVASTQQYELSTIKLAEITKISVEYPTKAAVKYEKRDGIWVMTAPYQQRADQQATQHILAILAAKSPDKFSANDLGRFGLDNPKLKLKLNDHEILFGTHNPVTESQYVLFNNTVYLIETSYEEAATVQEMEMLDKRLLMASQKIAGFDFSHLEQWEKAALNVDLEQARWKTSTQEATPKQEEMADWFQSYWSNPFATSVEKYTPDPKEAYPYFIIKLQDGTKIHVDKIQESPEMILGRPDEGIMYHFAPDFGFSMLNPPAGVKPQ